MPVQSMVMLPVPRLYSPRIAPWDASLLYNRGVAISPLAPFTIWASRSAGRARGAAALFHPALGGDLAAAVQAMAAVLVVVAWVLGH